MKISNFDIAGLSIRKTEGFAMETLTGQETVGALVAARLSRAIVFERVGLDYCCGGRKPLIQACAERGLRWEDVAEQVACHDAAPFEEETDWNAAPLSALADHIVTTHHGYLREALPRLAGLIEKVALAHGARHPELHELARVFGDFHLELNLHQMKEEKVLFPIIRKLEQSEAVPTHHCGTVNHPIAQMVQEHDDAGTALARMRELTGNFIPPQGACATYRVMLDGLMELEADMHIHIHKENHILFPRAATREAELAGRD